MLVLINPLPAALLLTAPPQPPLRSVVQHQRCHAPIAKIFETVEPKKGDEMEGLISKITDYGCFVRLGHAHDMGLVHMRTLSRERVPRPEIEDWIEREVCSPYFLHAHCNLFDICRSCGRRSGRSGPRCASRC